jgi:hypothetical protein
VKTTTAREELGGGERAGEREEEESEGEGETGG